MVNNTTTKHLNQNKMTSEQFVFWLQGFMEMANPTELNETQTQQIKDHLKLVLDKKTPDRNLVEPSNPFPTILPVAPPHGYPSNPNPYTITCDMPDPLNTPMC